MGRAPRADEAGGNYHAHNRGNAKHPIFVKDADYEAFERIIAEGLEKFPIVLIALPVDEQPLAQSLQLARRRFSH